MVCAVTGLDHTFAGEGLGLEEESTIPLLEPVLSYKIELPPECDAHQMLRKLRQLEEEEPQLHIVWEEQSSEIHAKLMGDADRDSAEPDQRAVWRGCLIWRGQHCL